jgi:hypothetical protein
MIRAALVPPLPQRPPEGFRIGEQQIEANPADGEMIAFPAGNVLGANDRQLGVLAASVAGFDGGFKDVVFHASIVTGGGLPFKVS